MMRFVLVLFTVMYLISGCSDENSTGPVDTYDFLTIDTVTFHRILLRVEGHSDGTPCAYTILKDGAPRWDGFLYRKDTVLEDTDLERGHMYGYKGYRFSLKDGAITDTTEWLYTQLRMYAGAKFTMSILAYGVQNSRFNTVALLSDGTILVAGIIQNKGNSIENVVTARQGSGGRVVSQVRFEVGSSGTPRENEGEIQAVGGTSSRDVWFVSVYGAVTHHTEKYFESTVYPESVNFGPGIRKIWTDAPDNVYFAGDSGRVWHFNGTDFRRIHSGFTGDIHDMFGDEYPILVTDGGASAPSAIYKITDGQVQPMYPGATVPTGLWSGNQNFYVGLGGGYTYTVQDGFTALPTDKPWTGYAISGIRNNMVAIGSGSEIRHYNGETWQDVSPGIDLTSITFHALAYAHGPDGVLVLAGTDRAGRAMLLTGTQM